MRFNAAKLLIDPYTHLLDGAFSYVPEIYGHVADDATGAGNLSLQDDRDSAGFVPYSIVTDHRPRDLVRPLEYKDFRAGPQCADLARFTY